MIDLETLGNTPGCVVLSISIVCIEDTNITRTWTLNVGEQLARGMHIDNDTLKWWMKQDDKVKANQFCGNDNFNHIVIEDILCFINEEFPDQYQLWSDSPRLDYGCFDALLRAYGHKYPIFHRNERCLRTIMKTMDELGIPYLPITKSHDPYEDCISQIDTFLSIEEKLGKLEQK
jgi:hypothetical protein